MSNELNDDLPRDLTVQEAKKKADELGIRLDLWFGSESYFAFKDGKVYPGSSFCEVIENAKNGVGATT